MAENPLLIFDGRCDFCKIWIEYWKQLTRGVDYAPSQEVGARYPQIPQEKFGQSVQLVMPEGEVISGARAVFTTLTYAPGLAWLLWIYNHVPGFALVSEAFYKLIAANRTFFYHVTRLTFGKGVRRLEYARVEWLFLRLLAVIYLIAFASLAGQITGLIGGRGIEPVGRYLEAIARSFGPRGYWLAPTVFWLGHGDTLLRAACWAGMAISLVLLLGFLERASLICLYVLYLSLSTAGQDFLSFQWDSLLLEAGFLTIFLGNSKAVVWLFRWLLFRLTFLSGVVKLTSHDPVWRDLTALSYHYLTQPLPTPVAWYMYQLPLWFQGVSTGFVFVVELFVPFLFLGPRRWRIFGGCALLLLQSLIFVTGNYTFFNLLTMSLCVFLFDDQALERLRLRHRAARTRPAIVAPAAAVILVLSISELWYTFFVSAPEPNALVRTTEPFQIVNTYGLFATMTTSRPEIIVQGSNDGQTWLDYQFKYKPGDLRTPPHWVAPYQPRLDWQMWFAALSSYQASPWFGNFMVRLLQGSPEVLGLLAKNPFPGSPPKYVRAELYDYSFTDFAMRRASGDWWKRTPLGAYFPQVSLRDVRAAR
ncbi:MAG TPA: lipase maturation factor family protein [Bryobacteraceae bacterium]|nr:lipase maturation factor family protein [Bryobacteraceae bacterium]